METPIWYTPQPFVPAPALSSGTVWRLVRQGKLPDRRAGCNVLIRTKAGAQFGPTLATVTP
jgi:hypothetical protein